MGLALLVWVDGGLLKRDLNFFGNEPRDLLFTQCECGFFIGLK